MTVYSQYRRCNQLQFPGDKQAGFIKETELWCAILQTIVRNIVMFMQVDILGCSVRKK